MVGPNGGCASATLFWGGGLTGDTTKPLEGGRDCVAVGGRPGGRVGAVRGWKGMGGGEILPVVLVAHKARTQAQLDGALLRQRLRSEDWAAGYPLAGPDGERLLERVRQHVEQNMVLATNLKLNRKIQ